MKPNSYFTEVDESQQQMRSDRGMYRLPGRAPSQSSGHWLLRSFLSIPVLILPFPSGLCTLFSSFLPHPFGVTFRSLTSCYSFTPSATRSVSSRPLYFLIASVSSHTVSVQADVCEQSGGRVGSYSGEFRQLEDQTVRLVPTTNQ
jgi:hypothetical protein